MRTLPSPTAVAAFSTLATIPADADVGEEVAPEVVDEASSEDDAADPVVRYRWEGPIVLEGTPTGDGRLIEPKALSWAIPEGGFLPLQYVHEDVGAHMNSVVVGGIETLSRRDGGVIWGTGYLDAMSDDERRAAKYAQAFGGVSVDLDEPAFEVRLSKEVVDERLAEEQAFLDAIFGPEGEPVDDGEVPQVPEPERNPDGSVTVMKAGPEDELMVMTSARIRGATLVAIPAFADARISLVGEVRRSELPLGTITASAALAAEDERVSLAAPPAAWFADPGLAGPTPINVTDDGRIFGHLASWDVCHIGSPAGEGVCITAPHSATGYAHFLNGLLRTAEGTDVAVGRLVMGGGHASVRASAAQATAHYDKTSAAVADVAVGEDAHGIWIAGALRQNLSAEQLRVLRASPLSGDWRQIGSNLELIGALVVNVPGFPIPRPSGLIASGGLATILAPGLVPPRRVARPGSPGALSADDLRWLKRLAARERAAAEAETRETVDALARERRLASALAARRALPA